MNPANCRTDASAATNNRRDRLSCRAASVTPTPKLLQEAGRILRGRGDYPLWLFGVIFPRSADERPHHQGGDHRERQRDDHVVRRAAPLLAERIEAHAPDYRA